jgi:hypothetical protein
MDKTTNNRTGPPSASNNEYTHCQASGLGTAQLINDDSALMAAKGGRHA